jgi:DNA mismatch repair protein MutS
MLPGVKNFNVQVIEAEGKVAFMHKIVKGGIDRSYGIYVAQLAGVPANVVERAKKVLLQLQNRSVKSIVDKTLQQQATQYDLMGSTNSNDYKNFVIKLSEIDVENLSPIQALNKLSKIKSSAQHELN